MKGWSRSARITAAQVPFSRGQPPLLSGCCFFFVTFFFLTSVKIFLPLRTCEAAGEWRSCRKCLPRTLKACSGCGQQLLLLFQTKHKGQRLLLAVRGDGTSLLSFLRHFHNIAAASKRLLFTCRPVALLLVHYFPLVSALRGDLPPPQSFCKSPAYHSPLVV